jgi:hypothetical protein
MSGPSAFWLDSRTGPRRGSGDDAYADVLLRHMADFDGVWGDIAPVEFTCTAWRLATPPISDPGFVRRHPRVLTARCERNTWDGSLIAHVTLASPLPAALSSSRTWWRDRGWQEWPEIFGQFVEPTQRDLTKVPFIRPVLLIDAPVPLDDLPATPDGPDGRVLETAHRALSVVVRELNQLLTPVLARLETAEPPA